VTYTQQHNPWFSPPSLQYVARFNPHGGFDSIGPGDRVTIANRFNQESTGRAVMRGPHGWVLNMGGRHGTPAVCTPSNFVKIKSRARGKRGVLGNPPAPCAACGMVSCACGCQGDPSRCICPSMAASNPGPWHPGGSHLYKGQVYHGGASPYHHGAGERYHHGGGTRYDGGWHPGGGHYEENPGYGDVQAWGGGPVRSWDDHVQARTQEALAEHPTGPHGQCIFHGAGCTPESHGRWSGSSSPPRITYGDVGRNPYDYDRPMPGQWHPSMEEEEAREKHERLRASMESIGGHRMNPADMYGNWYQPDYVGYNPGCSPNDGGGMDCYFTNPGGLLPGARYAFTNPVGTDELVPASGHEDCAYCMYTSSPPELVGFTDDGETVCETCWHNRHPYGNPGPGGLLPGARYAFSNPLPGELLPGAHYALNPIDIGGRSVPTSYSQGGRYHHVRVGDPDQYRGIRTKTLSQRKGIKARMGLRHGGGSEVQSYMFDAEMYEPEDAARWMEGHPTRDPLLMDISPKKATRRRYGKKKTKAKLKVHAGGKKKTRKKAAKKKAANPAKRKPGRAGLREFMSVDICDYSRCHVPATWRWKSGKATCGNHPGDRKKKHYPLKKKNPKAPPGVKKAQKKKRAWKIPAKKDRCTAKTKSGTCKGRRLSGGDQCALHANGIARTGKNPKAKKDKRTNRKRCRTSRTSQCAAKTNCGSRCKSYAVGRSKYCFMHAKPGTALGRTRVEGKSRSRKRK
jgi:hypothetical protein